MLAATGPCSYVPYCSSDVFSGDAPATATSKWAFRGKSILNALVQDLGGLGIASASDVAVAGCSAGAQTVVVNLDYVADLLAGVTKAPVSGIMDAGWFLNRVPLVARDTAPSIQFVRRCRDGSCVCARGVCAPPRAVSRRAHAVLCCTRQQEALALWNGQVNEACAVAYGDQRWQCYFSPVTVKYLKTRFFMHTEQFDAFQVRAARNMGRHATPMRSLSGGA